MTRKMISLFKRSAATILATLSLSFLSAAQNTDDFAIRGMHIDLRSQVMTIDALKDLARQASEEGLNTIIMEWEANFPFEENATLCGPYAYSKQEVSDFIAYAASLGVDIIPLQNCFGHSEYILRHERYAGIREGWKNFSQVCPLKFDQTKEVFTSIFTEVAQMHPSKYFHIGADETRQLGECRECSKYLRTHSRSELFCNYVTSMCEIVRSLGKVPVIWGDILLKYPEAVESLPKDLVVMDWNYGWDVKHFGDIDRIRESGLEIWGGSSLRCDPDNYFLVQWDKHFANLVDYFAFAREKGYTGMINTSWSTSGSYGYAFEKAYEVLRLIPEREVYPLSGFRILQEAFAQACRSSEPFVPEQFVKDYSASRFGFDAQDCKRMWGFFSTPQKPVNGPDFKKDLIETELANALEAQEMFSSLKPKANKKEFAHFVLMTDIRVNYLKFKLIDVVYESGDFSMGLAPQYVRDLDRLIKEQARLQKRFNKLNAGYLQAPEEYFGAWSYPMKMKELRKILSR